MSAKRINLLIAGSAETSAAIVHALRHHEAEICIHRVDNQSDLHKALERQDWHIAFSHLELSDFSALHFSQTLRKKGMAIPFVVINGTGDEEITIRCLESGSCQFIRHDEQYLLRLPDLVDAFLENAELENARRKIEKELLESEERYLDVFDNTSDLIQCIAIDGSFICTNQTWRTTMGYTEEEVKSLSLLDVLHPDSQSCCQARFERLLNGEILSCIDFKFLTKAGETVHLIGDCGSIIKEGMVVSTRGIFKNITEAVRAEEALKVSEARYQALYENAPDIYTSINARGEILSINHAGARMLGYEVEELIGESAAKVIHPEDQQAVFEYVGNYFKNPSEDGGTEYRKVRKDGSVFWVHQSVRLEQGVNEPRLLVISRDITDKHLLEEQLAHQAAHDMLTNLINRREFEIRLQRVLNSVSDSPEQHVLCFLDLDKFKIINDTCGHIAGDELLRQVATLLDGKMRSRDTLARLGGDEFGILMEHCSLAQAESFAEKIRVMVEGFVFHWRTHHFSLGVSIGMVLIPSGCSMSDVLNQADAACYAAKKEGKNRVHIYPATKG